MVEAAATYELVCTCGQTLRGERQPRHQIVACGGCGRPVFLLPASPFGAVRNPTPPRVTPRSGWRAWRGPLIAGAVCLALVLAIFQLTLPYLTRDRLRSDPIDGIAASVDPRQLIEDGRQALAQGRFRVAGELFEEANRRGRFGGEVRQLHRQAELLAQLSLRSLEEIVRHASLTRDPDEWARQFEDYRGRAFLFDDAVRLDVDGNPTLANHVIVVGDVVAQVALSDLELLQGLPLDDGPRLMFGARLAKCEREQGGDWVIRFTPSSGVLLSDLAAVETCYLTPLDDEAKAILQRQSRWLARIGEMANPASRKEK